MAARPTTLILDDIESVAMADPLGYQVASRIKERRAPAGGSIRKKANGSHPKGNQLGGAAGMEGVANENAAQSTAQVYAQAQLISELAALIVGMQRGDEQALKDLYDATVGKLFALAAAILRNPDDAEEVVCATYSYAWANAARFDDKRANALGWLLMLCRSRALDRLRRRRVGGISVGIDELATSPAGDEEQPEYLLSVLQQRSRVHAALNKLSAERRQLVALAFLQGLSHQEIANRSGMALGTVKSHVRRALAQLREDLEIE